MLSRLWQPCQPKEGSLVVQLWTGPEDWLSISWWVVSFTVSVNWTNSCWLWTVQLRQIGVEMPIECGIYSVSSVLKSTFLLLNVVLYIYISRFIVLLSLMVPSFCFKVVGSLYPHHALWLWEKSLCINHALTIEHSFVTFQVYSIVSHYFHLWSYSCRLFAIPSGYDFACLFFFK